MHSSTQITLNCLLDALLHMNHFNIVSGGTFPLESLWIWSECSTIWLLEELTGGTVPDFEGCVDQLAVFGTFGHLRNFAIYCSQFYQNSDLEPLAQHWVPEMSQGISSFCSAGGQGSELNNNLFPPCKVLLMNFCKHWSRHNINNTSDNNNDGCNTCNNNGCNNNNPNSSCNANNNINNTPSEIQDSHWNIKVKLNYIKLKNMEESKLIQ